MRALRYIIFGGAALFYLGMISGAVYLGQRIPFEKQWPMYEALRTTAAIIFAVVGAWLAIVYPERLKLSFGRPAETNTSTRNLRLLLAPAIHSTIILVILLTVGILTPMLKAIPWVLEHSLYFRQASFVLLVLLTLWQVSIVVVSIVPIEFLLEQASTEDAERRLDQHYGHRRQRL